MSTFLDVAPILLTCLVMFYVGISAFNRIAKEDNTPKIRLSVWSVLLGLLLFCLLFAWEYIYQYFIKGSRY